MPKAWISLGSNQNREHCICAAVAALRMHYGSLHISTVYESQALGFVGAPFYNLVVGIDTLTAPQTVVTTLRSIEDTLGRVRGLDKFASRTIDLDLLTWGNVVLHDNGLVLPRDEILTCAFVLRPLAEVAGWEQHPVLGKTYQTLWAAFDSASQPLQPATLSL